MLDLAQSAPTDQSKRRKFRIDTLKTIGWLTCHQMYKKKEISREGFIIIIFFI